MVPSKDDIRRQLGLMNTEDFTEEERETLKRVN